MEADAEREDVKLIVLDLVNANVEFNIAARTNSRNNISWAIKMEIQGPTGGQSG